MRTPLRLVRPDPSAQSGQNAPETPAAESGADASTGALVAAAREGDVIAFRHLVERYYERCLRFARNMGLGVEDAEEAVQDAFVRVHGALSRFAPGAAFEPWLFRILANRCRSTLTRGRWWRRIQVDDAAAIDSVPAAPEPDADLHEAISRALDSLPREQREAFLLRHVEGMEYHDMMAVTGAGLSALKMRVKRACDALRARLEELA